MCKTPVPEQTASSIVLALLAFHTLRNLRPYYKFTAPFVKVAAVEEDAWRRFRADEIDGLSLKELLSQVREIRC